jgi:hypothetical protein
MASTALKMREPDALGLGGNAECLAVAIEAEGSGGLHQFEPWLGVAEEQHLGRAVGSRYTTLMASYPLNADDIDDRRAGNSTQLVPTFLVV